MSKPSLGEAVLDLRADKQPLASDMAAAQSQTQRSLNSWGRNVKATATEIAGALAIVTAVIYGIDKALDATVGTYVKYADAVNELHRVSGLSIEDSSRLIQAADDLFVSQEKLTSGLEYAVRQGYKPSVEWLKKMADQVVSMPEGAERAALSFKLFGRQAGPEMLKLLEQGGTGIEQYMANVEDSLILTKANMEQVEDYKRSVDALGDAWTGFKVTGGKDAIDFLTTATKFMSVAIEDIQALTDGTWSLSRAGDILAQHFESFAAIHPGVDIPGFDDGTAAIERMDHAVDGLEQDYAGLMGLTMNIAQENQTYAEKMEGLRQKVFDYRAEIGHLQAQPYLTPEQKAHLEDLKLKLGDVRGEIQDVAAAHEEASKRIVFSLLQARLAADGLTQDEFELLVATGESFGIIDSSAADTALAVNDLVTEFSDGQGSVEDFTVAVGRAIDGLPPTITTTLTTNIVTNHIDNYSSSGRPTNSIDNPVAQAEGGDWMVTEPTLFLAGDAGPERATFTPQGAGLHQYDGPGDQAGGGSQENTFYGPVTFEVKTEDDLAKILRKLK